MHWMADAFWVYLDWTLGEIALALSILAALGVAALVSMVPTWFRQIRDQLGDK